MNPINLQSLLDAQSTLSNSTFKLYLSKFEITPPKENELKDILRLFAKTNTSFISIEGTAGNIGDWVEHTLDPILQLKYVYIKPHFAFFYFPNYYGKFIYCNLNLLLF